jgi:hypothetical protein
MIYHRRNVMTNAAPSAIYSLLLPNLLYFPHDSFAVERMCRGAERSLPGSLPTSEKIIARGTFEISNYCGAVKQFIDHLKGPIWPKSKS